jgi:predicted RNA-binding protein
MRRIIIWSLLKRQKLDLNIGSATVIITKKNMRRLWWNWRRLERRRAPGLLELLENVDQVEVEGDEIKMVSIFGEQKILRGRIRSYNNTDRKIILEAIE